MQGTLHKSARVLVAVAVGLVSQGAGEALAQTSDTGIQNNGVECVPESGNANAFSWLNQDGYQNTGGSAISVFCPLTEPSYDSYAANLVLFSLEIHYRDSAPTNCKVVYRASTGSLTFSSSMVSGTSATSGTPVVKLSGAFRIGSSTNAAVGVQCSLPSLATIVGTIGRKEVAVVTGGI
jgi:hypothetical protein